LTDLAAEITLTPFERLGIDAAILFADILLILEPMGVGLEYAAGDVPVIHRPVRSAVDVDRLQEFKVDKELSFVIETVKKTRASLGGKVPLIGFAGAPFTLASYLIEGGSSRNYVHTKQLFCSDPNAWNRLIQRLSSAVAPYLHAQISTGAQPIQPF